MVLKAYLEVIMTIKTSEMVADMTKLWSRSTCAIVSIWLCLCRWRILSSIGISGHLSQILSTCGVVWANTCIWYHLLLLWMLTILSSHHFVWHVHVRLIVQKIIHFGVLILHHICLVLMRLNHTDVISHLILHNWLVLKLFQTKILLICCTFVWWLVRRKNLSL